MENLQKRPVLDSIIVHLLQVSLAARRAESPTEKRNQEYRFDGGLEVASLSLPDISSHTLRIAVVGSVAAATSTLPGVGQAQGPWIEDRLAYVRSKLAK